jgi:ABC-2 type transport system ATP-binding protein
LKLSNIYKKFNHHLVLNNFTVEIPGKNTMVLGSNGSGKSTLFFILAGLVGYDSGTMVWKENNRAIHRQEVAIASDAIAIPEFFTMEQTIDIACSLYHDVPSPETWISDFGLQDKLKESMANLSQGTLKKVSILLALLKPSKLVLLDEPSVSLDQRSIAVLKSIILQDQRKFMISTHESNLFDEISDGVIQL